MPATHTEERIVHGETAEPHSIPYQLALKIDIGETDRYGLCGGSLLSLSYGMTAAHCLDLPGIVGIEIILGAHELKNAEEETQVRRHAPKENLKIHKDWTPTLLQNDIGLAKFTEPVEFNENIRPVLLPAKSEIDNNFENRESRDSGWGRIDDDNQETANQLQYITPNILTQTRCKIRFLGVVQDSHICSSGDNGHNTCQGDSGGPLTVPDKNGNHTQVGIVSFGIAFGCSKGWPTVYTRMTYFEQWVIDNTDGEVQWRP